MGERLLCKQEVIGSIPFSSTIFPWVDEVPDFEMTVFGKRIIIKASGLVLSHAAVVGHREEVCILTRASLRSSQATAQTE